MLLDIFTEKGIYHKVNGKWRRIALAHFSYDNPIVNGLAILLYASKKGLKVCWQFSYRLHLPRGVPKGIERC